MPHIRVHQLVVTALNAKQIDVALAAAEQLARLPAETTDAKVQTKLVEVLANVIKGKLGDMVASRGQRAQALTALISLNTRGALAFPSLIEVLKSDDPDLKPQVGTRFNEDAQFTRERIIKALEGIGPVVKDARPELEAALAVLEKMEKEDALFTPRSPSHSQSSNSTSERLRQAIGNIKGQSDRTGETMF